MMTPPTLPLYGSQRPIDAGGHPSFGTDDLTLSFVMAVLRRRWLLIALILVSTVGLGGYYLLRATPAVYEATTVLRMELGQLNLFQPGQNFSNENQLTTEIELLRRRQHRRCRYRFIGTPCSYCSLHEARKYRRSSRC